jgi:hypothetical protein
MATPQLTPSGGPTSQQIVICVTDRPFLYAYPAPMKSGFNIFRKLDNGETLFVSWRANLKQAEQLVWDLNELWPAEYEIQGGSDEPYIFATAPASHAN